MKINELAKNIALSMADQIETIGASAIISGNNGPYYNRETNVRNLAHWCVVFAEFFKYTGEDRFKDIVVILADAIMDSPHHNGLGVYKCRDTSGPDEVNGVIGPAWIIEGLIYAARVTGDDRYYARASLLFNVVPFNEKLGLWFRRNTKNEILGIDVTFNHQLWFAAAGAMINSYREDKDIACRLARFIERLPQNMKVRGNGRAGHFTSNDQNGIISYFGRIYRDCRSDILEKAGLPSMAYKEEGYNSFCAYGFVILKENMKEKISFFETPKFKKYLSYTASVPYLKGLEKADRKLDGTRVKSKLDPEYNLFAYGYNSPAFELGRVYDAFSLWTDELRKEYEKVCENQIKFTYDAEKNIFSKGTDDPVTLTARIYELAVGNAAFFS